jgi:hypothetical protein
MAKTCTHPNCNNPVFAKFLCRTHWLPLYGKTLRRTPIVPQSKPFKATTPIKKISDRQAKLNKAYSVLRAQFLKDHPSCQARIKCHGSEATDIHHKKSRGEYFLDSSTFLATCRACHMWIHSNDAAARALGFLESKLHD